jgi:glycosyltransferase involved in cell wall biosynthesis
MNTTAKDSTRSLGAQPRPAASSRPLRIAVNGTSAVTGGGVTYLLNLLPALAALGTAHEYVVLLGAHQRKLARELPANFRYRWITFGRPVSARRKLWEQTALPLLLRSEKIDVLLAPADVAPLLAPCPVVLAVRNPNPYWGPRGSNWKAKLRDRMLRLVTRLSAARASRVFFVSEHSRQRITPFLRSPVERTSVVYHGIGEEFRLERGATDAPGAAIAEGRYVLSVSAVRIHKNFETLIRAFSQLVREPGCSDMRLVIIGAVIDPPYFEQLTSLVRELTLEASVTFRGEMPYADLPAVYRGARLFVLPSLAETFGHPLVEAMASGVPVVATDLEIMREMCEDAAGYFHPGDPGSLFAEMRELLSNETLRQDRIRSGLARARKFSWDRTARQTVDLLEIAAGRQSVTRG